MKIPMERYKRTSQGTKRNKRGYSVDLARARADYIANKLNNPASILFYLKCAWNLTDKYLDDLLEIALTKDEPEKYFSSVASKEMKRNM